MKKIILFFSLVAILAACTSTPKAPFEASQLEVTSGNLWRANIFSPELNETIKVDVWTPNGYTTSKKYPVVYMHDGQNLFDANSTWNHQAWEIDSVMGMLIVENKIRPAVVVGIHSVDTTRIGDLMPERVVEMTPPGKVRDFIERVNAQYPTSIENEELNALLKTIYNQGQEIEELKAKLKKAKK